MSDEDVVKVGIHSARIAIQNAERSLESAARAADGALRNDRVLPPNGTPVRSAKLHGDEGLVEAHLGWYAKASASARTEHSVGIHSTAYVTSPEIHATMHRKLDEGHPGALEREDVRAASHMRAVQEDGIFARHMIWYRDAGSPEQRDHAWCHGASYRLQVSVHDAAHRAWEAGHRPPTQVQRPVAEDVTEWKRALGRLVDTWGSTGPDSHVIELAMRPDAEDEHVALDGLHRLLRALDPTIGHRTTHEDEHRRLKRPQIRRALGALEQEHETLRHGASFLNCVRCLTSARKWGPGLTPIVVDPWMDEQLEASMHDNANLRRRVADLEEGLREFGHMRVAWKMRERARQLLMLSEKRP